ncbi:Por secretion system C-terminal sorting domain-containing protein [Flavobacterium swingsii]|uniref:Por secretion system C-terminal sorting domain-containing protein n=1 Tax=Flavobacterium swingsii TaxID=498292 RepID=A0A1I0VHN3_9FLAO|nr:T9SS type A sorting domain-containing protein [Flavobacterium swingsii]SFA75822.1 Por secretion system C-terminal sorting domain-containing protein [Flavobacterium swingsii]
MKNTITSILMLLFVTANAQIGGGWDWAFNTGSLGGATIKHMKYTADGSEILFGGTALAAVYFGSTTLTATPQSGYAGNIKFFGKINSATGIPTIIRSFSNLPVNFDCITTDDAGNFYIGGAISDINPVDLGNGVSVSGLNKSVVAKFDASGTAIWAKTFTFGTTGSAQTNILKLAVSNSGNVFFWGFNPNVDVNNKRNSPLYKLDSNGNTLWFKDALNGSSVIGNTIKEPTLTDKFIDNNENVHLFHNAIGGYTFDGVAYPGGSASYGSTLISLNSSGTITKAQTYDGSVTNFQVNKTTGNLIFKWDQFNVNVAPFTNLPHLLASVIPSYANKFTGMVETDSNFNFIRAKDFSTTLDNPFQLTYNDDVYLALPNGKLIIQAQFEKTIGYTADVDYVYPIDATKYATAIIETDANWNISKFITGGKATSVFKQYITAYNDTYAMSAGFSSHNVLSPTTPTLPITSYGSVNLTGFNAASDLTTAYGVFSTSSSLRNDVAIVQTKSANFPTITSTTWLGNNTNWNDATNWTNGVPTTTMKALFNAPTPNYPLVSTSPTAASLQVNSGVSLALPTTLVLNAGLKNDGNITINNAGFFQGFGTKEWKGSGSVNFSGTAVSYFYANLFSNSLVLNTNLTTQYNLRIPTLTLNTAKVNLNNKTLSITDSSPTAITTANLTSYVYGGILERNIASAGSYEFPMGNFSFKQSAIIDVNNLIGTDKLSATFTAGVITGTTPSTSYNGVAITSALDGGWFKISSKTQPTSGNYDVTLKIQNSTNTSANVGDYVVIKRDNSTSPWAATGTYNLGSTTGGIVTVKNSNLTSFSDFAIGKGASDISLSNESFIQKTISLYPNPASSQITLNFENNLDKASLKIISIAGQVVFEKDNVSENNVSLDVSNFSIGVYYVQIINEDSVFNSKFIKQ